MISIKHNKGVEQDGVIWGHHAQLENGDSRLFNNVTLPGNRWLSLLILLIRNK